MSAKNKLNARSLIILSIAALILIIGFPIYLLYRDVSSDPQKNYELYKKTVPKEIIRFNELIYQIEKGDRKLEATIKYASDGWNHLKAMRCLKKAAAQGHCEAQYDLSLEYYRSGSLSGIKKGNEWLLKAGENGSLMAMKDLGFLHMSDERVYRLYFPRDYEKAFEWYQKAAAKGDMASKLQVANMYSTGKGVQKDLKKAEELYRKTAEKKPEMAYNGIAWMWAEEGIKLDEAEKLAKKALKYDPENPFILDTLGWIYYRQKRYKEAKEELLKAVKMTTLPAILDHLGDIYFALGQKEYARRQWRDALMDCKDYDLIKSINSKLNNLNSQTSK